jgi:hypothetical protein
MPFGQQKHFYEVSCMHTAFRTKAPFASTLPGRYYYDPAIYVQEQEHIFCRYKDQLNAKLS